MTTNARFSREIDGRGRTVRELLAGRKDSIDYYQREYKWQRKQVAELVADLAAKFLECHEDGNDIHGLCEPASSTTSAPRQRFSAQRSPPCPVLNLPRCKTLRSASRTQKCVKVSPTSRPMVNGERSAVT